MTHSKKLTSKKLYKSLVYGGMSPRPEPLSGELTKVDGRFSNVFWRFHVGKMKRSYPRLRFGVLTNTTLIYKNHSSQDTWSLFLYDYSIKSYGGRPRFVLKRRLRNKFLSCLESAISNIIKILRIETLYKTLTLKKKSHYERRRRY